MSLDDSKIIRTQISRKFEVILKPILDCWFKPVQTSVKKNIKKSWELKILIKDWNKSILGMSGSMLNLAVFQYQIISIWPISFTIYFWSIWKEIRPGYFKYAKNPAVFKHEKYQVVFKHVWKVPRHILNSKKITSLFCHPFKKYRGIF